MFSVCGQLASLVSTSQLVVLHQRCLGKLSSWNYNPRWDMQKKNSEVHEIGISYLHGAYSPESHSRSRRGQCCQHGTESCILVLSRGTALPIWSHGTEPAIGGESSVNKREEHGTSSKEARQLPPAHRGKSHRAPHPTTSLRRQQGGGRGSASPEMLTRGQAGFLPPPT